MSYYRLGNDHFIGVGYLDEYDDRYCESGYDVVAVFVNGGDNVGSSFYVVDDLDGFDVVYVIW